MDSDGDGDKRSAIIKVSKFSAHTNLPAKIKRMS